MFISVATERWIQWSVIIETEAPIYLRSTIWLGCHLHAWRQEDYRDSLLTVRVECETPTAYNRKVLTPNRS